LLNVG